MSIDGIVWTKPQVLYNFWSNALYNTTQKSHKTLQIFALKKCIQISVK